jgi:hypothetical protein
MATKKKASAAKSAKVTKKVAPKKVAKKAPKSIFAYDSKMQSFAPAKETNEFLSFRITRQTVYWSALLIYTLCLSLWVLKIQTDILDILRTIQ